MSKGFPAIHADVHRTPNGVPYLKRPGVVLIMRPDVNLDGVQEFLEGFDADLGFSDYLNDPVELGPAEKLCKFCGQLCYLSFGPRRTMNEHVDRYFDNIMKSGHGSVLEHAYYSFVFYGISRSVTHEMVRHRAGFGFSQVSQRYVDGSRLRFCLKPEYQQTPGLVALAETRFERAAREYDEDAERFLAMQEEGAGLMHGDARTDRRKKVQQAAREFLPNAAEAPIVVTGNVRSWRHFTEMRASEHSDVSIRAAAMRAFTILQGEAPVLFGDYRKVAVSDGTEAVVTDFHKV
ncbi:MAG TPA: FAD-dependent thymidylate synthase [Candidatus Paceibacterota bacterium]|nr:FAD-dependent thymidylate synthase [Candidatus Paceibacterota bacterium]